MSGGGEKKAFSYTISGQKYPLSRFYPQSVCVLEFPLSTLDIVLSGQKSNGDVTFRGFRNTNLGSLKKKHESLRDLDFIKEHFKEFFGRKEIRRRRTEKGGSFSWAQV